jgi:hypothetical protein
MNDIYGGQNVTSKKRGEFVELFFSFSCMQYLKEQRWTNVAKADPPVALNKPSAFCPFPSSFTTSEDYSREGYSKVRVGYDQVGGRGPAGGHYFSTPSAERVRDVLSPEAESFPDRGVCVGV